RRPWKVRGRVPRQIVGPDSSDRCADDVLAGLQSPDPVPPELVRSTRRDAGHERELTASVREPDLLDDDGDRLDRIAVLVGHTAGDRAVPLENDIDVLANVARFDRDRLARLRRARLTELRSDVPALTDSHAKRHRPGAADLVTAVLVRRRFRHRGGWSRTHHQSNARAGDRLAVRSH